MAAQPKPAKSPAIAPQPAVVLLSFKNMARLKAIIKENKNVRVKIFGILPFFMSSFEKLFSFIPWFAQKKR